MNGLRSDYLENLAQVCLDKFNNVVACDNLPILKSGDRFICNLDTSHEKGSHYIAISIKNGRSIYFDSYGFPCLNKHIKNTFLSSNITKIYYSKKPIQTSVSLFCGYFCLAFLICDEQGVTLEQFVSMFIENDVKANEKIASEIIKRSLARKF